MYKGVLNENRILAIKRLNESGNKQGEAELLAKVTTLGKLNQMLIEMWGYCAEGKHRLLVYEFMDNQNLIEIVFNRVYQLDCSWILPSTVMIRSELKLIEV